MDANRLGETGADFDDVPQRPPPRQTVGDGGVAYFGLPAADSSDILPGMKIALASDHAGFDYKTALAQWLRDHGHEVRDFGTSSAEPVDYPDFIRPAAESVARGECERGIVLGGSGNGEAIVANKVPGVRCGLCWNEEVARLNRQHNDANVLSLGQRTITRDLALRIVEVWLATPFEGGRHLRRVQKIEGHAA